ncbi:MAG TPA: hypothetical protein DIU15_11000 [Deltaproteobacteria bacterium]|nr:hypothetical protein [Deltaproteobacteria bacterium]HCP46564.1 hypothetical protein [Deltaproteobacteria bacterium]
MGRGPLSGEAAMVSPEDRDLYAMGSGGRRLAQRKPLGCALIHYSPPLVQPAGACAHAGPSQGRLSIHPMQGW